MAVDRFPEIWAALTSDHLCRILDRLKPRVKGRQLRFQCPECGRFEGWVYEPKDGKGPRLHCNRKNNCAFEISLWDYLKQQHSGEGRAALEELAATVGIRLDEKSPTGPPQDSQRARTYFTLPPVPTSAPEATLEATDGLLSEKQRDYEAAFTGSPADTYLAARGVPVDMRRSARFGFSPDFPANGRTWGPRLTYPVVSIAGNIVAIEARAIAEGQEPKCICDGEKIGGLFAPHGTPINFDGLHVTEGPIDAVALCVAGVNAVATCGARLPEWFGRCVAFRQIYAAQDADKAGDAAAAKFAEELARRGTIVRRRRPLDEGQDWGDYLRAGRETVQAAYWRACGDPELLISIRLAHSRLWTRVEFLEGHQDNGRQSRGELLQRLAVDLQELRRMVDAAGADTDPFIDLAAVDVLGEIIVQLREHEVTP